MSQPPRTRAEGIEGQARNGRVTSDANRFEEAQVVYRRLLERATEAAAAGNYAIAAALALRGSGAEMWIFAGNTVAAGEPQGHAEMNAIGAAQQLLALSSGSRQEALAALEADGIVEIRQALARTASSRLYSTLEPCPMCTVAALNAHVGHVTYALADPEAGALAPERLDRLPALWGQTARQQRLKVDHCSSDPNAPADLFITDDLLGQLETTFQRSRRALDSQLATRGFLNIEALTGTAGELVRARTGR